MAKRNRQDLFVEEYLVDLNATQAAIRAGYSPNTANEQGSRLLANVKVKSKIDRAMAERSKRTGINQDRVIEELAKLALVNVADVIDVNTATVLENAKPEDLACIQSVKVKKTTKGKNVIEEREIRFYDKKGSLELLGKHLGLFKDKLEVETDMDLNIVIDYGEDENEEG